MRTTRRIGALSYNSVSKAVRLHKAGIRSEDLPQHADGLQQLREAPIKHHISGKERHDTGKAKISRLKQGRKYISKQQSGNDTQKL
jgi:hypothetical protein